MVVRGEEWGEEMVWDPHVHTAIFQMDNQQDPLHTTWSSVQGYVVAWMGGEFGGEWIHV